MKDIILSPAFIKFYFDFNRYCLSASVMAGVYFKSFKLGGISFCTIGYLTAIIAYQYFQKQEYVFYANLQLPKKELLIKTFILNCIASFLYLLLWLI